MSFDCVWWDLIFLYCLIGNGPKLLILVRVKDGWQIAALSFGNSSINWGFVLVFIYLQHRHFASTLFTTVLSLTIQYFSRDNERNCSLLQWWNILWTTSVIKLVTGSLVGKIIGYLELCWIFACLSLTSTFNKFGWITGFNSSSLFSLGTTFFFSLMQETLLCMFRVALIIKYFYSHINYSCLWLFYFVICLL